jgi:rhodanese-related sulfurtransferase
MKSESADAMVAAARARVENLTPRDVAAALDEDAVLVDVREPTERNTHGWIPGSIAAPRGMLELWADPGSVYHRPELEPQRRTIVYCASGARSALAADTLQRLGYGNVAHLDGGLRAWKQSGFPVQS